MGIDNPLGLAGPAGTVAEVLTIVGVLLHWFSLPPAAVCVMLRFRSSRGVERQQMRWVAVGVADAVGLLLIGVPSGLGLAPGWISNLTYPALLLPPVAVAVAVLRYRLYELDRVISRTLTYALLTVLLGLGYAGAVLVLASCSAAWAGGRRAGPWPGPPRPPRPCSSRPAAASRPWSTRPCGRPGPRLWLRHAP